MKIISDVSLSMPFFSLHLTVATATVAFCTVHHLAHFINKHGSRTRTRIFSSGWLENCPFLIGFSAFSTWTCTRMLPRPSLVWLWRSCPVAVLTLVHCAGHVTIHLLLSWLLGCNDFCDVTKNAIAPWRKVHVHMRSAERHAKRLRASADTMHRCNRCSESG